MLKGSGSSSIFYTTLSTLFFMAILYIPTKNIDPYGFFHAVLQGIIRLFPITSVLLLAFAIGKITTDLHTGAYLASLAKNGLHPALLGTAVFLLASVISFATGTSWGTFSIMIPIAIPMGFSLEVSLPLVVGAVISGGVFGDHCSPISDTTIISSLAAECDVVDHVRTQLPYALLGGFVASIFFSVFGFILS